MISTGCVKPAGEGLERNSEPLVFRCEERPQRHLFSVFTPPGRGVHNDNIRGLRCLTYLAD